MDPRANFRCWHLSEISIFIFWIFFKKPILAKCSRTRPLFTSCSRTNTLLGFLVNTVREQFAKVREQCSPNPLLSLSGEHRSWAICQSSWTLFTKPPFCTFKRTMFVNSLPKFVKSVHQTKSVTRFGEHFSRTVITWLITKVFTNFWVIT